MTALATPTDAPVTTPPRPRTPRIYRWTVERFEAMIAAGLVAEGARLELLDGIITEKMTIGSLHAFVTRQLNRMLQERLGDAWVVGVQDPVALSETSRPEPDVWIASGPASRYRERVPAPADLVLVVEVADTSLDIDRGLKLELYAKAGIPEYWIVNVETSEIERHLRPRADGTYGSKAVYGLDDAFTTELLGEVRVGALFA